MRKEECISRINSVLRDYFGETPSKRNDSCKRVYASFIENGIFNEDNKKVCPFEKF